MRRIIFVLATLFLCHGALAQEPIDLVRNMMKQHPTCQATYFKGGETHTVRKPAFQNYMYQYQYCGTITRENEHPAVKEDHSIAAYMYGVKWIDLGGGGPPVAAGDVRFGRYNIIKQQFGSGRVRYNIHSSIDMREDRHQVYWQFHAKSASLPARICENEFARAGDNTYNRTYLPAVLDREQDGRACVFFDDGINDAVSAMLKLLASRPVHILHYYN